MRRKQGSQRQVNGAATGAPGHETNHCPPPPITTTTQSNGSSSTEAETETDDNTKFQQDFLAKLFKFKNDGVNIDTILVSKSSSQQNRVEYKAHKIVLRTCPYFEKLFILSEKMSELGDTTLMDRDENNIEKHFIDTEPVILEIILKYIYTGVIDVTLDNFHKIFQASKLLELDHLTNKLLKIRPTGSLTKDSWLELFRYAITSEKNDHFLQEVYTYIKHNSTDTDEFFRSPEFMSLELEELKILVTPSSRFFTTHKKYQVMILNWWNNKRSTVSMEDIVELLNSTFENENQDKQLNSSSHPDGNIFVKEQEQGQSVANENSGDGTTSTSPTLLESPGSKSVENFNFSNETSTSTTTRKRKRDQSSTTEKNQPNDSVSLESNKINHEVKVKRKSSKSDFVVIAENATNILLDEDSLFKSCNICKKVFGGAYKDRKTDLYVHLERNHHEVRKQEWKKYVEMEKKIDNKNSSSVGSGTIEVGTGIDGYGNNSTILKRQRRKNLKYTDGDDESEINRNGSMNNISLPTLNEGSTSDLAGTSLISITSEGEDSQQSQVKRSRDRPSVYDGLRNSPASSTSVKIKPKPKKPFGYKTKRGSGIGSKPHWKQVQKMNRNQLLESSSSSSSISPTHQTSNNSLSNYINNGNKIVITECYIKVQRLDEATIKRYTSASVSKTTSSDSPSKLKSNLDGLSDVTDFDLDLLEDDWNPSVKKSVNEEIWLPAKSFVTSTSSSENSAVEKFEWDNCEIIFLAKKLESNTLMRYSFKKRTFIGNEIILPFSNLENFGLVANSQSKRLYLIGGNIFSGNLITSSEINSFPLDKANDWDNSRFWLKEMELESERSLFSSILIGKYIYILGGSNQDKPTNYLERYNTDGDYTEWPDPYLKDCNLHFCRERFSVAHYENKIFMSGGIGKHWEKARSSQKLRTTEVFDIEKRKSYSLNDMLYKKVDHKLIFFRDKLYSIGGVINSKKTNTIEIFDLESKEWTDGPQMNFKRSNLAAFVLDDNLYVLGGNEGDPTMEKLDLDLGWVIIKCGSFPKDRELDFSQSVLVNSKYLYNFPYESKDNSSAQETQLLTIDSSENPNNNNGTD